MTTVSLNLQHIHDISNLNPAIFLGGATARNRFYLCPGIGSGSVAGSRLTAGILVPRYNRGSTRFLSLPPPPTPHTAPPHRCLPRIARYATSHHNSKIGSAACLEAPRAGRPTPLHPAANPLTQHPLPSSPRQVLWRPRTVDYKSMNRNSQPADRTIPTPCRPPPPPCPQGPAHVHHSVRGHANDAYQSPVRAHGT